MAKTALLAILLLGTATSLVIGAADSASAQGAPAQWSQPGSARPRDLLALRDDLTDLDESLSALPRDYWRYPEFQQRADNLRDDVTCLKAQMRRYAQTHAQGIGASRTEVVALRRRVTALTNDVETAQGRSDWAASHSLPAGTEVQVRLEQPVSSRTARREERVEATVVEPVRLERRIMVPAGTVVSGVVSDVAPAGRMRDNGELKIAFDSLTWENGARMPLRADVVAVVETRRGGVPARDVGLGALLGGFVGNIIDGRKGALIGAVVGASGAVVAGRGQNVELPEGTLLTLRLVEPFRLARR